MSAERNRGDWIPWYIADSASWLELSLAARGAAEGIARKMGRTSGELHLGSRGLKGLALLLGCSWEELEPALVELLSGDHPRLLLSADHRVLIDPDHASRKRPTSTERVRRFRERRNAGNDGNVSPSHVTHASVPSRLISSDLSLGSDLPRSEDPQQVTAREPKRPAPSEPPPAPAPAAEELPDAPPAWWAQAVATAELTTGRTCDMPAARWLEYRGSRERKGWQATQRNAVSWLATVLAADARRVRELRRGPEVTRQPVDEDAPWMRAALAGGDR